MNILVAIIFIYGIRGEEQFPEPLTRLNNVITTRIKDILKEHSRSQDPSYYISLQRAVELPISFLDKKIEAYNAFKDKKMAEESLISSPDIQSVAYSERASAPRKALTRLEKKILKLLKKLGIYDNFQRRVFKAIFSDENQLMKLKKKLDDLGNKDMNSDSDSLWDFIIDLF